jgi:hypothetical protein
VQGGWGRGWGAVLWPAGKGKCVVAGRVWGRRREVLVLGAGETVGVGVAAALAKGLGNTLLVWRLGLTEIKN